MKFGFFWPIGLSYVGLAGFEKILADFWVLADF